MNYEYEPLVNITILVRDPSTNETLRSITFPIEIDNENEPPYNLTLVREYFDENFLLKIDCFSFLALSIPEDTPVGSIVGVLDALDDDFNQTITYSTTNPMFSIIHNQLVLEASLSRDYQHIIPLVIRAMDNGQPPTFVRLSSSFFLLLFNRRGFFLD